MANKKPKMEVNYQEIILNKINAVELEETNDSSKSFLENSLEVVECDEENKLVTLKNNSKIKFTNILMIELEVSGSFKIKNDLEGESFKEFIEEHKLDLGRPILNNSSLILSFITEKMTSNPLIMPPAIWKEIDDED